MIAHAVLAPQETDYHRTWCWGDIVDCVGTPSCVALVARHSASASCRASASWQYCQHHRPISCTPQHRPLGDAYAGIAVISSIVAMVQRCDGCICISAMVPNQHMAAASVISSGVAAHDECRAQPTNCGWCMHNRLQCGFAPRGENAASRLPRLHLWLLSPSTA